MFKTMVKFLPETVSVVFEEIPDKITLMIEITGCQNRCPGCHSPWLQQHIGEELTCKKLRELIEKNKGVNCILFSGEGNNFDELMHLAFEVKRIDSKLSTALYSGRDTLGEDTSKAMAAFDYIKIGSYKVEFGPLNKETTNQKLYKVNREIVKEDKNFTETKVGVEDITSKFWKKKYD